jgi:putative addiction module component (TIGR02574 family)
MSTATALKELESWTAEDRLDLLYGLWDQLVDEGFKPSLSPELKEEIDRRWANYRANPSSGLTWEQVVEEVKGDR